MLKPCQTFATHGLWPTKLFRPLDFPGSNTGVGWHFLLGDLLTRVELTSLVSLAGGFFFPLWSHEDVFVWFVSLGIKLTNINIHE